MIGTPNQGSELPAPAMQGIDFNSPSGSTENKNINTPAVVESEPKPLQLGVQPLSVNDNSQQPQTTSLQAPTVPVVASSSPVAGADDVDVIEKVWVEKAKNIADKNRGNPRDKGFELASVKAEYIKSRYGKEIKLAEETKK